MNDSNRSPTAMSQALSTLVITAVPLAAFLAFAIQPMMGKRLLPIYGGTSGTWLGCMVYFQLTLLLGYSHTPMPPENIGWFLLPLECVASPAHDSHIVPGMSGVAM